ncbi:MAG: hypothetical protein J6K21_03020 [Bacilli bacterium]|nr:hypothetical protein [Bacilli bacterium]
MKLKNMFPVVLCILIGFFMGNFMFKQYSQKVDTVSLTGENLYFLQAGVFSSESSMKEAMSKSSYYIYRKENNMYYSYVGIVKNEKNLEKLKDYFKQEGYDIYVREMFVSNISFLTILDQYETLLQETTDNKIIKSIENQVLGKYEELVIDDKN